MHAALAGYAPSPHQTCLQDTACSPSPPPPAPAGAAAQPVPLPLPWLHPPAAPAAGPHAPPAPCPCIAHAGHRAMPVLEHEEHSPPGRRPMEAAAAGCRKRAAPHKPWHCFPPEARRLVARRGLPLARRQCALLLAQVRHHAIRLRLQGIQIGLPPSIVGLQRHESRVQEREKMCGASVTGLESAPLLHQASEPACVRPPPHAAAWPCTSCRSASRSRRPASSRAASAPSICASAASRSAATARRCPPNSRMIWGGQWEGRRERCSPF